MIERENKDTIDGAQMCAEDRAPIIFPKTPNDSPTLRLLPFLLNRKGQPSQQVLEPRVADCRQSKSLIFLVFGLGRLKQCASLRHACTSTFNFECAHQPACVAHQISQNEQFRLGKLPKPHSNCSNTTQRRTSTKQQSHDGTGNPAVYR